MKLKYEIEFDIKTNDLIKTRKRYNLMMKFFNKLLSDLLECFYNGKVKLITPSKTISPHSLEGCYELSEEV